VQRLDRDRHAGGARVRQQAGEPLFDQRACAGNVSAVLRNAADHHHQAAGAEFAGFVDRAPIIVDRVREAGPPLRSEPAAAAIAGHSQAGIADQSRGLPEAERSHLVAPRRYAENAMTRAARNDLVEAPLFP